MQFMNDRLVEIFTGNHIHAATTQNFRNNATIQLEYGFLRFLFISIAATKRNIRNISQVSFYVAFYPKRQVRCAS